MSETGPVTTPEARAWLAGDMTTEDYFAWAYAKERPRAEAAVAKAMQERTCRRSLFAVLSGYIQTAREGQ